MAARGWVEDPMVTFSAEPCFPTEEPEVAACRDIVPAAIVTMLLAVPPGAALAWIAVRDRRR